MAMNQNHKSPPLAAVTPLFFVVLWSTGFIAAKYSAPHASPLLLLALRFAIAAVIMAGLSVMAGARWPGLRIGAHAVLAGALLHGVYLSAVFWVIGRGMPAGVVALLTGLQPFITAMLAYVLLREPLNRRIWAGLSLGLLGVGLVVSPRLSSGFTGVTPLTLAIAFTGITAIALGTVQQKARASGIDLRTGAVLQYGGATVVAGLGALLLEKPHFEYQSLVLWLSLGWLVFGLSIGAVSLLMILLRRGSAGGVAGLIYLVPGSTALMAFAAFGEVLIPIQLIGMAVCAAGVMLVSRG
jgi:drug/metabolite transporter (DMT)-like permease